MVISIHVVICFWFGRMLMEWLLTGALTRMDRAVEANISSLSPPAGEGEAVP